MPASVEGLKGVEAKSLAQQELASYPKGHSDRGRYIDNQTNSMWECY